jgi:NAD(P)-dependent dehydrogenase (short-subunit alcohol dehydrogenase family)
MLKRGARALLEQEERMSKKVLITGASAGFGLLTTKTLLERGHTVVASMRSPAGKNGEIAGELRSAGASIVEIDVTDESSVETGVKAATEAAGGLDVVVNNAGVGVLGLQEAFVTEDWQKVFEVNVFGVQRLNRAVLPQLRAQGSGLVLYVSSLLGRITLPFYGPYNATKWALEAMAENYRTELSGLGVDQCIVEPGGYPTSFMDRLITPSDSARSEAYGDLADAARGMIESFEQALAENPAQNPQDVADAIARVIDTPAGQRPFRTVVDRMGMGDQVAAYNDELARITAAIYGAFGIEGMLDLRRD